MSAVWDLKPQERWWMYKVGWSGLEFGVTHVVTRTGLPRDEVRKSKPIKKESERKGRKQGKSEECCSFHNSGVTTVVSEEIQVRD